MGSHFKFEHDGFPMNIYIYIYIYIYICDARTRQQVDFHSIIIKVDLDCEYDPFIM